MIISLSMTIRNCAPWLAVVRSDAGAEFETACDSWVPGGGVVVIACVSVPNDQGDVAPGDGALAKSSNGAIIFYNSEEAALERRPLG